MSVSLSAVSRVPKECFELQGYEGRKLVFKNPSVMGIINASPNSFYGFTSRDQAIDKAADMVQAGAAILDVGGEATSLNVKLDANGHSISVEQELERVTPIVEAIRQRFDVAISVDTSQAQVMSAVIQLGADIINDQRTLKGEGTLNVVAQAGVSVCLMHFFKNRTPACNDPSEMLEQIATDLKMGIARCKSAGLCDHQIIIDVGFGQGNYGKNCVENYYLLANLPRFLDFDCPILSGWSRKSMIRDVLGGVPVEQRLHGSLAAAVIAVLKGSSIIRTHDVKATVDALSITRYAMQSSVELSKEGLL